MIEYQSRAGLIMTLPIQKDTELELSLKEAEEDLLFAQLHLAAADGKVPFEDLIFIRRLIATARDQINALRRSST